MGTRSFIAVKEGDQFKGVYCHWDGYPEGVGATLAKHYINEAQAFELINKGDMSSLGPTLNECEFYTDRGEKLNISTLATESQVASKAKGCGCEYVYILKDGAWVCTALYEDYNNDEN